MSVKIIQKDNPILRQKAKEVPLNEINSEKIKNIVKQMSKALSESANGVGLAAPQIGVSLAMFLISEEVKNKSPHLLAKHSERYEDKTAEKITPEEKKKQKHFVFINPRLIKSSQKKALMTEGCLSIEGVFGNIKRSRQVIVEAYNEKGEKFRVGASGLFAQVLQHEINHLNGELFTDKAEKFEKIPPTKK
ncbi:MAG: peptide deformylase [Patescibacteria group bacterium]|mgnify:FL=1